MIILSPAKKLNEDPCPNTTLGKTHPRFVEQMEVLLSYAQKLSPRDLMALMGISEKLAELNHARYAAMKFPIDIEKEVQALFIFDGDVYSALGARDLDDDAISYLGDNLRIVSGLYGYLRPSDAVLPYRLEMGIKFPTKKGANLYDFWRDVLAPALRDEMLERGDKVLFNLASQEYSKAVDFSRMEGIRAVNIIFKERKNGAYRVFGMHAKRMRGIMTRHMAMNGVKDVEALLEFKGEDFEYNPELSDESNLVFTREWRSLVECQKA